MHNSRDFAGGIRWLANGGGARVMEKGLNEFDAGDVVAGWKLAIGEFL